MRFLLHVHRRVCVNQHFHYLRMAGEGCPMQSCLAMLETVLRLHSSLQQESNRVSAPVFASPNETIFKLLLCGVCFERAVRVDVPRQNIYTPSTSRSFEIQTGSALG